MTSTTGWRRADYGPTRQRHMLRGLVPANNYSDSTYHTSTIDIQSTRVDVVDTARDLGVIIDSQLFSAQVADLSRSVSFQLRQLRPIIRSLTMEAAKTITQAFISCRLDYCNSLFLTVWYNRSFPAAGPEVWNSLPPALRGSELTFDRFKQVLKTYFTLVMKSQRLVIIDFGAIYVCIVCIGE